MINKKFTANEDILNRKEQALNQHNSIFIKISTAKGGIQPNL